MKEQESVGRAVPCAPQSQPNATFVVESIAAGDGTPALPVNNDMKLRDDPRIVLDAAECAIALFAHAVNGEKLEHEKAKTMFDKVAHVLAWCYVRSIETSVKNEKTREPKGKRRPRRLLEGDRTRKHHVRSIETSVKNEKESEVKL